MEFGGVGRLVGWVVTGTLRAATAVKLSRPEVMAISRTADAIVAMLTVLGVDLLRDESAMRRNRVSALPPLGAYTVRRVGGRGLLLVVLARAMFLCFFPGVAGQIGRPQETGRRDGKPESHSLMSEANGQLLMVTFWPKARLVGQKRCLAKWQSCCDDLL